MSLSPKLSQQAMKKLAGKETAERITFQVRINTPFIAKEIQTLTEWGGELLFDSGLMAIIEIPASKVHKLAGWPAVISIH